MIPKELLSHPKVKKVDSLHAIETRVEDKGHHRLSALNIVPLLRDLLFRFPMSRLCQFESFGGMLQSLFREFMSGQMVTLSVMLHRRSVSVFRE